ncbi:MAG: type 4a pilus biogenesis protein PilO [Pseudomonadota bacterium]
MAKKINLPQIDFAALQERVQGQFRGLDPKDPSQWPALPRAAACLALMVALIGALWYFWLSDFQTELDTEIASEATLRQDFQGKVTKAANLQALKKQREQVQLYVTQLEKQLPSKAEMAALLSDINQAGIGRSLQFELFKPGDVQVRDYYAELPITVRVTGRYHDIGAFTSDVAHLSRIVTLNNLSISPAKDGQLVMSVTARTFRYLDSDEVETQRKAAGAKK